MATPGAGMMRMAHMAHDTQLNAAQRAGVAMSAAPGVAVARPLATGAATMTNPVLTTRLILRRPIAADLANFTAFMMSDRAIHFGAYRNEGKAFRAFAAELGHWEIYGHGMWTVTMRGDDTALGLVGPWTPPDWPETEIGWMMFSEQTEGTGIATEAARAALRHAYGVLGWTTAVSYIDHHNTRSIRLAERLGATVDDFAKRPHAHPDCMVYRHSKPQDLP